ncbi:MAG: threonine-phosphate decarboxylase CobD [Nitrospiraceae bacterium]
MTRIDSHGGDVYAAARESGRSLRRLMDFSASVNPLGPSPHAVRASRSALVYMVHYPDPGCVALREALAKRYGLPAESFLIGSGSSELIQLVPAALSIRRALVLGPTFSEYARAVRLHGGEVSQLDAERSEQYQPPLRETLSALHAARRSFDAVFVCNPNSPTGQAVSNGELSEVVRSAGRRGVWVVLDEAFVDYCEERSLLRDVAEHSRLIVLRSFTKFYALPGLRIGYLAGAPEVVRRIRDRQPPWSVNALAQVAALASVTDVRHVNRSLAFMQAERPRLARQVERLPDVRVYSSAANFLMVELPSWMTAGALAGVLRREGILIRDCSRVPGLTEQTVRIAVRTSRENRRLVAAFRRALLRGIPDA